MLPRALLFSPDDRASATVQQALLSMRCEVERCADIFAAIERLTTHEFGIVVVDWREELEAGFLLRTARDLKSNSTAFALALAEPHQLVLPSESRADAVLAKPFTAEDATAALSQVLGLSPAKQPASMAEPANTASAPRQQVYKSTSSCFDTPLSPPEVRHYYPQPYVPDQQRPARRGVSRTISLIAIFWPVVIAASLFAYDQWPSLRPHRAMQTASQLVTGFSSHVRQRLHREPLSPVAEVSTPTPVPGTASEDLLADYAQPAPMWTFTREAPADPDAVILQALPASTRTLLSPARPRLQHTALNPDIPASLRFPPPPSPAARQVLTASADWTRDAIALSEFTARALLEKQVRPHYPESALRAGLDGLVVLRALVANDGTIRDLKLVRGHLVLARAAFDAVRQWRFRPYQCNGKNVEMQTFITIDFKRPS